MCVHHTFLGCLAQDRFILLFSVYVRFIQHIRQMHPNNFYIQKGIIFVTAFKAPLLQKTVFIYVTGPKTHKE
jgi:hypothetical protein